MDGRLRSGGWSERKKYPCNVANFLLASGEYQVSGHSGIAGHESSCSLISRPSRIHSISRKPLDHLQLLKSTAKANGQCAASSRSRPMAFYYTRKPGQLATVGDGTSPYICCSIPVRAPSVQTWRLMRRSERSLKEYFLRFNVRFTEPFLTTVVAMDVSLRGEIATGVQMFAMSSRRSRSRLLNLNFLQTPDRCGLNTGYDLL